MRREATATAPTIDEAIEAARLELGISDEIDVEIEIIKNEMPQLTNHSYEYAQSALSNMNLDIVKIGSGDTVIKQLPEVGDVVYTNQKVFLLTSDDKSFEMLDLTGYTRKEVSQLWSLTGLRFKLDGYGIVYEQSIVPGTIVDQNDEIQVKFKDIENKVDE